MNDNIININPGLAAKGESWFATVNFRYYNKGPVLDNQVLQQQWNSDTGAVEWRDVETVYDV